MLAQYRTHPEHERPPPTRTPTPHLSWTRNFLLEKRAFQTRKENVVICKGILYFLPLEKKRTGNSEDSGFGMIENKRFSVEL